MISRVLDADRYPREALHAAFRGAFADYLLGPFRISVAEWPDFLRRQGVDLEASRVVSVAGGIVAFALVAPRPRSRRWRLAAMGALPSARGTGAAPALLDDFVARAGAAGMGTELECFESNERALRLYRGRGFEARYRLNGWSWPTERESDAAWRASNASSDPDGAKIDSRDLAIGEFARQEGLDWLDAIGSSLSDLPFQVAADSLRANSRPLQAWRAARAQCVFSLPPLGDSGPIIVHSLIDPASDQAGAAAIARALVARHPGRGITLPALQRDDLGGRALAEAGFVRAPLNQVLMIR